MEYSRDTMAYTFITCGILTGDILLNLKSLYSLKSITDRVPMSHGEGVVTKT